MNRGTEAIARTITGATAWYQEALAKLLQGPHPGPRELRTAKKTAPILAKTAIILGATGIALCPITPQACILALSPILAPALAIAWRHTWRSILASGIDREIPALLAYLLPYTHTPRYIVDLLANLPPKAFKWSTREAERLRLILASGEDPNTALKKLADTTPSKRLSRALTDYLAAQTLGAPRSQVTITLLNHALETVRDSWKRYTELGRVISEAIITVVIALAALTPMTILTGTGTAAIAAAAIIAPLTGAAALLTARPSMGEPKPSPLVAILALTAPLTAGALAYKGLHAQALAILALAAPPLEIAWRRASKTLEEAARSLRLAAEAAKYRGDYEAHIEKAKKAAGPLVEALAEAMKIAGKLGASGALQGIAQVLEEAARSIQAVKATATLLAALATASVLVGAYTIQLIQDAATQAGLPTGKGMLPILHAVAPIAPLPASILHRGRTPSLIPSIAALAGLQLLL